MNGTGASFLLFPCRAVQYFSRTVNSNGEERNCLRKRREKRFYKEIVKSHNLLKTLLRMGKFLI